MRTSRFLALFTVIVGVIIASPAPASAAESTGTPLPDRSYLIYNIRGLKCLDVDGGGTGENTAVQQWTCDLAWNKQWLLTAASVNNVSAYRIKPRHAPGKCLSVRDGSVASGAQYVIRTCTTSWDQFFLLYAGPAGGNAKYVMPYYTSRAWAGDSNWKALTIPPGDDLYWKNQTRAENQSRVPWNGSEGSQQWRLYEARAGNIPLTT